MQACTCDSLHRTIEQFHFCCFRVMAIIRLWRWVQFCLFNHNNAYWSHTIFKVGLI